MQGEILVQAGLLRPDALGAVKARQERSGEDLEEAVLALQLLSERELLRGIAQVRGHQYLTTEKIAELKIPDEVIDRIPVRISEALAVMPFRMNPDGTLWVLAGRELTPAEVDNLRRVADVKAVSQILARKRTVKAAHRRHYYRDPHAFQELEEAELLARLGPPVPDNETDAEISIEEASGETTAPGAKEDTRKVLQALPEEVRALQRENERLRFAHSLAHSVANLHDLDALSGELLAAMLDLFSSDIVGFALTGDNGAPLLLESRRRVPSDDTRLAISSSIVTSVVNAQRPLLLLDAQADERFSREESIVTRKVRSVVCAPIISKGKALGALYLESNAVSSFGGDDLQMLTLLASVAAGALENVLTLTRTEDRIVARTTLRRFFPAEVVERSINAGDHVSLLPTRTEATLVVARMPDAAKLIEAQDDPGEAMHRLDDALETLIGIAFANGASLEGQLRTGASAIFGPPRGEQEHVERAVTAAVEMAKAALQREGAAGLCIGICTGPMTIGAMGPTSRIQLLALGEVADAAHQLCALARPGEVLATSEVCDAGSRFLSWDETAARVELRGEPRPVFSLRWR